MSPFILRAAMIAGILAVAAPASRALAWGATGHRLIGQAAAAALPEETPAFLRTPQAVQDIGELAREPDRWRASGRTHDTTRDPAHFVDVDDDGRVLGGPRLDSLPPTRAEYETVLRAVGADSAKAGYLPYAIVDGWQQLTKDFAYYRILRAAVPREHDRARKAWLRRDLARRESLTTADLGIWAHYVGDASQPMHVSVHYNGWGAYPNPKGYTQDKVHVPFEGDYVRRNVSLEQVRAAMTPLRACEEPIEICTARYLMITANTVIPYFMLQRDGGFADGDPRGQAFARQRVAAGAAELRDLVVAAWRASAKASIGFPVLSVDQVVNGGADPYAALHGDD